MANFSILNSPTLPFLVGTVASDPSGNDTVILYPNTAFPPVYGVGTLLRTSLNRTVTVTGLVAVPASLAMLGTGMIGLLGYARKRRHLSCEMPR